MGVFALASAPGLIAFVGFARKLVSFEDTASRRALAVALALGSVVLALRALPTITGAPAHPCHTQQAAEGPG
jgi:hypothetical protein